MSYKQLYLVFFVLIGFLSRDCRAWGEIGHGAVGEIAERHLTPEAKNLVFQILGLEPLAISGVWSDKVRSDSRFDHFSPYHYVEVPVGQKYEDLPPDQIAKKSLHSILSLVPGKLIDPKISQPEKAILLRYLVHAVGDVHMPLHVGNGLDQGANLCLVKWIDPLSRQEVLTNLHTLWDEGMFEYTEAEFRKTSKPYPGQKRYYGYQEFLAQTLDKKSSLHLENPPALGKVGGLDLLTWYAEAQALHPVVYPDKDPKIAPSKRAYCKTVDPKTLQVVDGSFRASKVPKISADYLRRSLPIVQRQVLLGGLRLAGMLNEAANKGKVKPIGSKTLENLTRATAIELRDRQVK